MQKTLIVASNTNTCDEDNTASFGVPGDAGRILNIQDDFLSIQQMRICSSMYCYLATWYIIIPKSYTGRREIKSKERRLLRELVRGIEHERVV